MELVEANILCKPLEFYFGVEENQIYIQGLDWDSYGFVKEGGKWWCYGIRWM
jgi:hypothetical protein